MATKTGTTACGHRSEEIKFILGRKYGFETRVVTTDAHGREVIHLNGQPVEIQRDADLNAFVVFH